MNKILTRLIIANERWHCDITACIECQYSVINLLRLYAVGSQLRYNEVRYI